MVELQIQQPNENGSVFYNPGFIRNCAGCPLCCLPWRSIRSV